MSMLSFRSQAIIADLRKLGKASGLAFGIFLLERAKSGYFQFQLETGYGGGGTIRAALAQCWSALEGWPAVQAPLVSIEDCERLAPDSEHYSSLYTSAAIDAVGIACNVLSYIKSGDEQLLLDSAELLRDTVDLFIQNTSKSPQQDTEIYILRHPLMQSELGYLYSDLEFLQRQANPTIGSASLARVIDQGYDRVWLR